MNKLALLLPLGLMVLVASASNSYATDYFVKPTGSDSNNCLNWNGACATIAGAITKATDDNGDVIKVAKGLYKPSATISVNKTLDIIGGYTEGGLMPKANASLTIISGDIDNDDIVDVKGITQSYSDIDGPYLEGDTPNSGNISRAFNVPNKSVMFKNLTITGFKGSVSDFHGSVIYGADIKGKTIELDTVDVIGNRNYSLGNVMAYSAGDKSKLVIKNSRFLHNFGDRGSAITTHRNVDLEISDSIFKFNLARAGTAGHNGGDGAVHTQGESDVAINNSLFAYNDSDLAGALRVDKFVDILNCTFVGNKSAADAGAVLFGTSATATVNYSTFFANEAAANGGAIRSDNVAAAAVKLRMSLLLANTAGVEGDNLSSANAVYQDEGYNLIGHGGVSGIEVGSLNLTATSFTASEVLEDIIDPALMSNGGMSESVAIKSTSPARNKIPNDSMPFYGVGRSSDYPFTSLSQAHGALKSYDNYQAGIYYFDLGGIYADANSSYAFTSGPLVTQFSTYVDASGWLLIAASNSSAPALQAYMEVTKLARASDQILNRTILASNKFNFDEVKLSTAANIQDPVDIRTAKANVITAIKDFKMLPNNYSADPVYGQGEWTALQGAAHINSTTCATNSGVEDDLNKFIYEACGNSVGMMWAPAVHGESQDSGEGSHGDNLNLWVRNSEALCNGAITTTDGRGLPRSDYLNPNDPEQYGEVHKCDIGAFEYNDGYKYDCYAEDGQRAENFIDFDAAGGSGSASHRNCLGGDLSTITPKALLDNFGSIDFRFVLLLLSIIPLRKRKLA